MIDWSRVLNEYGKTIAIRSKTVRNQKITNNTFFRSSRQINYHSIGELSTITIFSSM